MTNRNRSINTKTVDLANPNLQGKWNRDLDPSYRINQAEVFSRSSSIMQEPVAPDRFSFLRVETYDSVLSQRLQSPESCATGSPFTTL